MSQVVLITGCTTGGIGYALYVILMTSIGLSLVLNDCQLYRAQEFARHGCIVYATSRKVETIADFSDPKIHKLALDVTSDENVQIVVQEVLTREGKLDVVVNNAGVISPGAILDLRATGLLLI
jgi:NAD(P)-dependent dehydrogenase (short-subunit alcohol dehydrogenase family)